MRWIAEIWKRISPRDRHILVMVVCFVLVCIGISVLIRGEAKIQIRAKKKMPEVIDKYKPTTAPARLKLETKDFKMEQWGYGGGTKTIKATSAGVTIHKGP